ncbi:MAG: tRNA (adenosine(37)-N6)-threonylcarbamoyltransferase complex ATPase subunit type 1 TsaE [Candidatus Zixiibacteriota bacterium]
MKKVLDIISHSEKETIALAKKLLPLFKTGDVLVLSGQLGSGKTIFVRGLALAAGINDNLVNSPSYTMLNEYPGEKPLYHFDLYRLGDISELYELGWEEYLIRDGLIVVEWGEKAKEFLPLQYYQIDFKIIDELQRNIKLTFIENG